MRRLLYICFLLLLIPIINVKALSVSQNNIDMVINNSKDIELYVNSDNEISEVDFTLVYSNNDIKAEFVVDSKYDDNTPNSIKHSIIFGNKLSGKILLGVIKITSNNNIGNGNINIYNAKGIDGDNSYNLDNQNIMVNVSDKEVKKERLISKIESKLVNINLIDEKYDYDINVDSDIDELDLKPIGINDDVVIDISSQKVKDKQIIIKAKLDDYEEVYKINLKINSNKLVVDNDKFIEDDSYKNKWVIISIVLGIVLIISLIINKLNK